MDTTQLQDATSGWRRSFAPMVAARRDAVSPSSFPSSSAFGVAADTASRVAGGHDFVLSVLSMRAEPVFVLSRNGEVVWRNDAASHTLERSRCLCLHDGRLSIAATGACVFRALQDAIPAPVAPALPASARAAPTAPAAPFRPASTTGETYRVDESAAAGRNVERVVIEVPSRAGESRAFIDGRRVHLWNEWLWLVRVHGLRSGREPSASALRALLGLTPAECRLVAALYSRAVLKAAARELKIRTRLRGRTCATCFGSARYGIRWNWCA